MNNVELSGLTVRLGQHCQCGARIAVIVEGKSPPVAALHCPECKRFRQWLPAEAFQFLVELIAIYGRAVEPINIFEQVNRGTAADLSLDSAEI